ncbi:MAG: hypothetical protein M0P74_02690 [Syntrophales bacterium]|jgi:tetratricopeptide (TPR) repeat protein|nr:hypothetical protein [Syntrophales bacterium]
MMTDTDLWYHLAGGRYFWQNGASVNDAFFSYIAPAKSWYNYYWLFQAIIYKIFQGTGYYGLIVLRCLLYFLTALFVCFFFIGRRENRTRTELLLGLFLFIACTLVILPRELIVRPHLFSYLFIVVFLYILEKSRDKIWVLPLLGILWANIHGIEYPVMFLIAFAYLAEIYWRRFRKTETGEPVGKKEKWLLISIFYTIFITPGISGLVQTPFSVSFQNAAYQHLYVAELLPIPFQRFFVFAPVTILGLLSSLQNIIVILTAVFALVGLWKKTLRISHAVLFIGAGLLLARHGRFTYEFTLLSIPLLYSGILMVAKKDWLPRRVFDIAFLVVALLIPLLVFHGMMGRRPAYPFSEANLPAGVVRFLNQHVAGGRILNEPNTGGYLPWALGPKFKIFMDMQLTIFSDTDFAFASNAFSDAGVFKAFIQKYDPSFISVSLSRSNFDKVVANDSRFAPVFFDHAELLYINKTHYGALVDKYELKAIDPFRFREIKYEELSAKVLADMFAEAWRMRAEDPVNYGANHILGSIAVVRRQYDQALSYADVIVGRYPDLSHGYALRADALFGMERYEEAVRLYEKAMELGQTSRAENVYWNLHIAYAKLKEYKKAYRLLSKYVNPFGPNADYKEIYQLGVSAAAVGKSREAATFLKIAQIKAPSTDPEYVQKIAAQLGVLDINIP